MTPEGPLTAPDNEAVPDVASVSQALAELTPPTLAEVHEFAPPYRPASARAVLAIAFLALGFVFQFVLGLPLAPVYYALLVGWVVAFALFFRFLDKGPEAPAFFTLRLALFALEVLVATGLAHVLGASSWLATLFLLFPTVEWNMLFPGRWGLAGSGLAVLGSGALIAGESIGFVPPESLFQSVETVYRDLPYAVGAFLVSAVVILGLSVGVGVYAEASRRQSRQMRRLSRHYRALSEQLEQAYQDLRNAQAELVGSAKMATLGQLVAGIAHEINTPLGALNSNYDVIRRALDRLQKILADEVVDEDELEDVRRIVKAIDGVEATNDLAVARMVQLVSSLRSFGRPDRSEIDRVDLHEGIESTLQILRHELKKIEVRKEFGELPVVECYPGQLNQVFMNLLVNAVHAMPDGGTITVRTWGEDGRAVVQVEDTGVGISGPNLKYIFEPGFTTKGHRVGMGMGLLIVRQIIDRHGGRITVDSEPGRGTTFTISLPLRLPARARSGAAEGGSS
ncbi:MAG TPA: ATP-binding protein [Longimicrobiales bacterium]|nr:ATP-binding protein [Longimicrobiales bacterium]